ncbi:MAG: hypothetical protein US18_C0045G0008 [Parcubacteria group bacterium GW2011_GWB1_36_5]|nr:MAG: hypothetical protein US18_C0045G0008 [Parcubacteria group bacterium GW2011_GWB1_36_5]
MLYDFPGKKFRLLFNLSKGKKITFTSYGMKKYTLFLSVLVFTLVFSLLGFNNSASAQVTTGSGGGGGSSSLPAGCQPGFLFSPITGQSCTVTNLPPGCQPGFNFSTTTGQSCSVSTNNPVISGVSGPQTLNINQQGTWTVTAYDNQYPELHYGVDWGDSPAPEKGTAFTASVQQSATFTHRYSQAGIYNPTFVVTNSNRSQEQSAQTSPSVRVGNAVTVTPVGLILIVTTIL